METKKLLSQHNTLGSGRIFGFVFSDFFVFLPKDYSLSVFVFNWLRHLHALTIQVLNFRQSLDVVWKSGMQRDFNQFKVSS